LVEFYIKMIAVSASKELQYRATSVLLLLGIAVEAAFYLILWQAVIRAGGGSLHGWNGGQIAAYFIVWTLVRNMSIAFTPYGFEERIRDGTFSSALLRPQHPIHHDLAEFAGWKLVMTALWIPVAAAFAVAFRPAMTVTALEAGVFVVAVWAGFVARTLYLWLLGLMTFWTTRASALFDLFLAAELLFSGRLVPIDFLPGWARDVAAVLPFQWVFSFPIEALVRDLDGVDLLHGLLMQALWIGIGVTLVAVTWRFAVRRHSAVGS
jgi:ABC-2 type transport system permease protein